MGGRKAFDSMSLDNLWIVLVGCLVICDAAPTIAPTASQEDQDLAEVIH